MASVLPAIEEYLRVAKSLGFLKYYILSYDDTVPEKNSYESMNALKELVQKLNIIMAQTKPQNEISLEKIDDEVEIGEKKIDQQKLSLDDERLVQIRVDRNEMNRRINAFINRKRKEADAVNAKEFCNNILLDDDNPVIVEEVINSCARVDSIYIPRSGCKSHVKVSRVDNLWGPQTYQPIKEEVDEKPNLSELREKSNLEDIEERLKNMESHLKIKSENTIKRSVYSRLKDLEDRILFLEGLSPDYFSVKAQMYQSPTKRSKANNPYKDYSIEDLQTRMKNLKEKLKLKSQNLSENALKS